VQSTRSWNEEQKEWQTKCLKGSNTIRYPATMIFKLFSGAETHFHPRRNRNCQNQGLAVEKNKSLLTITLCSDQDESVSDHILYWIWQ
jgi:hypothetical protein